MCNPKKVMIHLARSIEEAWRRTVVQAASAEGEATELGRIVAEIRLDEEMGETALEMLESVLENGFDDFEPWARDDRGRLFREVENAVMIFEPGTGALTVEARLAETLTAEERAEAVAAGFTAGEVAAEAVARYYDDGWGGRTRERALEEAGEKGERQLDEAAEVLHREQNPEAFAEAEARAREKAGLLAGEKLERMKTDARRSMRTRLQKTLHDSEQRVYRIMNRAVGEAYRQSLLRVVEESGGRVLRDEKTGSVIDMELELY